MVATDSEIVSPGECNSALQSNQQHLMNHTLEPSLGRQSSIYSLTLDEFQHSLCENGKNFGSMNMDDFINSIWTAEENQVRAQAQDHTANGNSMDMAIDRQPSLQRQVSLSIPEPLCRKTVEEVWSEINDNGGQNHVQNPDYTTTQGQSTFGEMTLEDFLIRAGIVREQNNNNNYPPAPPQQPPFGTYQYPGMGPDFVNKSVCPGGIRVGQVPGLGIGSPVSPVSSDGVCVNQVENGNQFGLDSGGLRGGRKRILDGPVHKVVERRQRRMIKNRESAARSRARKQAYTVELEGELNQLKEENAVLKHALADLERKRKQQYYEASRMKLNVQTKAEKANRRLRSMRRSSSGPY